MRAFISERLPFGACMFHSNWAPARVSCFGAESTWVVLGFGEFKFNLCNGADGTSSRMSWVRWVRHVCNSCQKVVFSVRYPWKLLLNGLRWCVSAKCMCFSTLCVLRYVTTLFAYELSSRSKVLCLPSQHLWLPAGASAPNIWFHQSCLKNQQINMDLVTTCWSARQVCQQAESCEKLPQI